MDLTLNNLQWLIFHKTKQNDFMNSFDYLYLSVIL